MVVSDIKFLFWTCNIKHEKSALTHKHGKSKQMAQCFLSNLHQSFLNRKNLQNMSCTGIGRIHYSNCLPKMLQRSKKRSQILDTHRKLL